MRVCSAEDCNKFGRTRGMCDLHYQRQVRSGAFSTCAERECTKGVVSNSLCEAHYRRELRSRNPEGATCLIADCSARPTGKGWCVRHYGLHSRYNIDPQEYENILKAQGGMCAICGSNKKLHMDHDHDTGNIRGILCGLCNRGIGFLKDDPNVLLSASKYLKKWKG